LKKEMPGMNPNLQSQRLVSQLHFFYISIMALKHLHTRLCPLRLCTLMIYKILKDLLSSLVQISRHTCSGLCFHFFSGNSPVMDILDIDKDIRNPQMCASYVVEIYLNLMASEVFLLRVLLRYFWGT
jgi:hypothetical protein